MARLILFLLLFAALALALAAAVMALRAVRAPAPAPLPVRQEDPMPRAMRNVAYVALLLLLAGLTSGWLGPA